MPATRTGSQAHMAVNGVFKMTMVSSRRCGGPVSGGVQRAVHEKDSRHSFAAQGLPCTLFRFQIQMREHGDILSTRKPVAELCSLSC